MTRKKIFSGFLMGAIGILMVMSFMPEGFSDRLNRNLTCIERGRNLKCLAYDEDQIDTIVVTHDLPGEADDYTELVYDHRNCHHNARFVIPILDVLDHPHSVEVLDCIHQGHEGDHLPQIDNYVINTVGRPSGPT